MSKGASVAGSCGDGPLGAGTAGLSFGDSVAWLPDHGLLRWPHGGTAAAARRGIAAGYPASLPLSAEAFTRAVRRVPSLPPAAEFGFQLLLGHLGGGRRVRVCLRDRPVGRGGGPSGAPP